MLFDGFAEVCSVEMGIYLGCGDALMPQQILNLSNVGATLQKMCGEGVAQRVWANFLIYAGTLCRLLYYGEYHHSRKSLATIVQKEKIPTASASPTLWGG